MTSDRTPTALWIVPVADLGGVARHVLDVARVGVPGWRIVVLCPEGPLAERLRTQGAAVITAPFGPGAGVRVSRSSLARIAKALRPDIVHSHLAYADIINAWTRLPRGTRRVTTEHGIAGDDSVYHSSGVQAHAMALVHRLRFPRFDSVIAVSNATREAMIAKWHVRQHIEVIPNGVDLPPGVVPRSGPSDSLRILSLSRLAPEKRIDVLLEAFATLRRARPEATLTIAGEGPLRLPLEARARRLGLCDGVDFPGFVEPNTAMDRADVVVQLSVWENCSYTLLDAAARGLGIVASDVGGNREFLGPESLVDTRDISAVARGLGRTPVATSGSRRTVSQMCLSIARRYSESRSPSRTRGSPS